MPSIGMLMLYQAAVPRQHRHLLRKRVIVGDDSAGVAHGAEILAGIE